MMLTLERATRQGLGALKYTLPAKTVISIIEDATRLLQAENTLVEINDLPPSVEVVVVGDTHGQMHDVIRMFETIGYPSGERLFVFNGDYVDRGAWGLELLVSLLSWKLAMPHRVVMLRGNHESATCTMLYGFVGELQAKYSPRDSKSVYKAFRKLFTHLPLSALIAGNTLVLHGGLFRRPSAQAPSRRGRKRRRADAAAAASTDSLRLGTLQDLRNATKGGMDPVGWGSSTVATDVLWSDPLPSDGLFLNETRGLGLLFGPDMTQQFLADNRLRLVIRSHEGPDARYDRPDVGSMLEGYAFDHQVEGGMLMTVFSAPDYPQFQVSSDRFNNRGAVAVLSAPDYAQPRMVQYEAQQPRPQARPFYELGVPDSDEDIGAVAQPCGSDGTDGSLDADNSLALQDDGTSAECEQGAVAAARDAAQQALDGGRPRGSGSEPQDKPPEVAAPGAAGSGAARGGGAAGGATAQGECDSCTPLSPLLVALAAGPVPLDAQGPNCPSSDAAAADVSAPPADTDAVSIRSPQRTMQAPKRCTEAAATMCVAADAADSSMGDTSIAMPSTRPYPSGRDQPLEDAALDTSVACLWEQFSETTGNAEPAAAPLQQEPASGRPDRPSEAGHLAFPHTSADSSATPHMPLVGAQGRRL